MLSVQHDPLLKLSWNINIPHENDLLCKTLNADNNVWQRGFKYVRIGKVLCPIELHFSLDCTYAIDTHFCYCS